MSQTNLSDTSRGVCHRWAVSSVGRVVGRGGHGAVVWMAVWSSVGRVMASCPVLAWA